jgi:hypothetical protein
VTPDGHAITLLFDRYLAGAGSGFGPAVDRKDCTVQIPFKVMPGNQLQIEGVDYRGFVSLPEGGSSEIQYMHGLATPAGTQFQIHDRNSQQLVGPTDQDYLIESRPMPMAEGCGAVKRQLFLKTVITARANVAGDMALSTLDSLDSTLGEKRRVEFKVSVVPCQKEHGRGHR